jgi:hypothetical protein
MSQGYSKDYGLPSLDTLGAIQRGPNNKDLFLTNNFTLSIKRCPSVTYFAQTVTMSELGGEPLEVPYMISPNLKVPKAAAAFKNMTVKFLLDRNLTGYEEILNWIYEGTHYVDFSKIKPLYECLSEAFIIVTTNRKQPAIKITLEGIFPVEISGFEMKNTDTEFSPIQITVEFAITQARLEPV